MRKVLISFLLLLMLLLFISGIYTYISSEVEYLKVYVPPVDNISLYHKEIVFTIYGLNGFEMYKKYYKRSKMLPENYKIKLLKAMTDIIIKDESAPFNYNHNNYWQIAMMESKGINPLLLNGKIINYYANILLQTQDISSYQSNIIRLYTLSKLSKKYPNNELYRLYLNTSSYGKNIYGIAAASEYYYNKPIESINLLEQAFLISLISIKNNIQLEDNFKILDRSARIIIRKLYEDGYINNEYYNSIIRKKIILVKQKDIIVAPSYVKEVIKELKNDKRINIGKENIYVYTGYNHELHIAARNVIDKYMKKQDPKLQYSFVLVNRKTQGVDVAIGSRIDDSLKNRSFHMKRQMASTFKPIVYLTAFNKGFKPSDIITDRSYTFNLGNIKYTPKNYKDYFMGKIPIRYGLVYSLNNTTVKLAEKVGLKNVANMAKKLGMKSDIKPYYAMALGGFPATPLNVAQIYSTIANYGMRKIPSLIIKVEVDNGVVYNYKEAPKRVVEESVAYQTVYIMQDVVNKGTAKSAKLLKGTAAKTGTSNNVTDGWTVIMFGNYIAVGWIGYDNFQSLGKNLTGGSIVAPMLATFQHAVFGKNMEFVFNPPANIKFVRVKRFNGLQTNEKSKGSYIEAFHKDNLPAYDTKIQVKKKKSKGE